MTSIRGQVVEFHCGFDQPILEKPAVPAPERVQLRLNLIAEEFFELLRACIPLEGKGLARSDVEHAYKETLSAIKVGRTAKPDLVQVADALADIDYVVEGTRLEFGINGKPIAKLVHDANMAKLGGDKRGDGKVLKPDGWQPADIAGELRRQGAVTS